MADFFFFNIDNGDKARLEDRGGSAQLVLMELSPSHEEPSLSFSALNPWEFLRSIFNVTCYYTGITYIFFIYI